MTREHLWSDWMDALLPNPPGAEYVEYKDSMKKKQPFSENPFVRTRQGAPNKKTIKVVCQNCNSGWMGDLEEAAKPYLTPLILGDSVRLDSTAKRALCEWITLKILVAENNGYAGFPADPIFDQSTRDRFKRSQEIPFGFRMWAGRCKGTKWQTGFYRHVTGLSPPPAPPVHARRKNAQTVTLGIGQFMVHVTATIHEPLYPWLELQGVVPPFHVLWPLTDTDITWPPQFFILDADADILARSLYNDLIQSPRVIWAD